MSGLQKTGATTKWLYDLARVFIKGAAHVAMVILTGTGVAQMLDESGAVQHLAAPPLTFRYFALSVLIGGAIKAFAFLEEKPLPDFSTTSTNTNPPIPPSII